MRISLDKNVKHTYKNSKQSRLALEKAPYSKHCVYDILETFNYSKINELSVQERWNILAELIARATIRSVM